MPKVQKKEEIALKISYIAYIIEFSRFNTPFRCGKF